MYQIRDFKLLFFIDLNSLHVKKSDISYRIHLFRYVASIIFSENMKITINYFFYSIFSLIANYSTILLPKRDILFLREVVKFF